MASAWVATDFGGPEVLQLVEVDVPVPGPGEVTIEVRGVGINPTDYKSFRSGNDRSKLPMRLGHELSGVLVTVGEGAEIDGGGGEVGDEVLAYRVPGSYATAVNVPASSVFRKPAALDFAEAANLLLVGATAADLLRVADVSEGDTVLVHGASGAVGISLVQQARLAGLRVIGTTSARNADLVRSFGAEPVEYGDGLEQRVRELAPDGVDASLDTVGTDEAVDVSLAVTRSRDRIATVAAFARGRELGLRVLGGSVPESREFRDLIRGHLVQLAAEGKLAVPMGRVFPFEEAPAALELLSTGHPGGKLALVR